MISGQGLLTGLLLLMFIVVLGFLVTGEYRRKVAVSGILVPDSGAVQVRAPADGMVEELVVSQGSRVGKGDTLLHLRTGMAQINGMDVTYRLQQENHRQEMLLRRQLDDVGNSNRLKKQAIMAQKFTLEQKVLWVTEQIANERDVQVLLEQKSRRLEQLRKRGFVSEHDLAQASVELLKQKNRVRQLQLELAETTRSLTETSNRLELLDVESHEQKARLQRMLSELVQESVRLEAGNIREIVAPAAGTLAVIYPGQGQAVMNRQALVTIIPEGAQLQAELYVPSRASGFIEPAMPVSLRLDAFPHQKFGLVKGSISEISRSVMSPSDAQRDNTGTEPYFRATALLDRQGISAWGQEFAFRAGMQFEADIQLESRSLLEWLLEPLFIKARG